MKKFLLKIVNIFIRPSLKGTLIKKGTQVKLTYGGGISADKVVIVLYSMIRQSARAIGMDERQLMNRIIKIDKKVVKLNKPKKSYKK